MRCLLLVCLLAACDDDVDLTGVYRVDEHVASSPCGADEPVTGGPAYLKFRKDAFFGGEIFVYDECTDAAATDCQSAGGLFDGFIEPIDDGWRNFVSYSSNSGLNCSLGINDATAILSGTKLVIDSNEYREALELPEAQCTAEEAEKRGTDMPCEMHERITATTL